MVRSEPHEVGVELPEALSAAHRSSSTDAISSTRALAAPSIGELRLDAIHRPSPERGV